MEALIKSEEKKLELKDEFDALASVWYKETRMLSFVRQKAIHPSYQRIIGMGKEALPFIFEELTKGKGDWMWALECITRLPKNPVPAGATYKEAVRIWLQWATEHGYF